jgi:phosphopantetheinyl transferase
MYRESGAPLFREVSGVNVSISHSGVYAIAAVSPHPIGVDIERVRHRDPRMYDYISSEEEQELLDGHEWQTPTAITTLWTIKESVMKAATVGLEWAPRTLLIESIARGDGGVATSVVRDPSGVRWYVITVRDTSNYIISFAEPV